MEQSEQGKALNENAAVQNHQYELIDEEAAKSENAAVLQLVGWRQYKDLEGRTWFCSEKTKQCSRQFPLFVILTNDQKQEVHTLLAQRAPRPSSSHSLVSSPSRHGPPPPPSSSYSSEPPPPPAVQLSSGPSPSPPPYVTSSPPLANDCSWHQMDSWAGAPFLTIHNEFITLITTEQRLAEALQSLHESLFKADNTGYEFFHSVVTERFNFGHVHVSCMVTPGRYVNMELVCS